MARLGGRTNTSELERRNTCEGNIYDAVDR